MRTLVSLIALLGGGAVPGQEPDADTLPVTSLPLPATPPAVRFVALARERGPNPRRDWSDMQVTLWDIDPAREEDRAVRRRVLGRSHWNAAPLSGSPTLLRWQIPNALVGKGRGYFVKLLRVDYATFTVTELLEAPQVRSLGCSGELVYLQTSAGQSLLRVDTGEVTPLAAELHVLARHGDDWLVEVGGALARFDAARAEVVRRYATIEADPTREQHGWTEWDGGRFAVRNGRFVDEDGAAIGALPFGRPAIVYRELRVWDLETGAESRVRARMQARGGSGVPVIPEPMYTELVGGLFRYTERRPAEGEHADLHDYRLERDAEWVTIDIATGKELLRTPYRPRDLPQTDPMVEHRVPDYLRGRFADSPIQGWGPTQDLALAFLDYKGIDLELPESGVIKFRAACRSDDGAQLLVLHRDTFHLGNLETKELVSWAAPAALGEADVDLYAVTMR